MDDVSFQVNRGEIVGFLGPNAAGKTTVLNMIMGLLPSDDGQIELLGTLGGAKRREMRMRIGHLQEKPYVYPEMTARAYLEFFAGLYNVAEPQRRTEDVLQRVGLTHGADRVLGEFSRGMQQRACLARVMLHRPELLILDEPTLGLDPNGIAEMRAIFREMKTEGVTLLFSSHQLAEMERICDSVIFMQAGHVIAAGRPGELLPGLTNDATLSIEVYEPAAKWIAAPRAVPNVVDAQEAGTHRLAVTVDSGSGDGLQERRAYLSNALTTLGATVLSVGAAAPTLEDLFLGLTAGGLHAKAPPTTATKGH